MTFQVGQTYRRRDIHRLFGGQQQGGISTPASHPFILLFMADTGKDYGYNDGFAADGTLYYVGEGQEGDQVFLRGNQAIRDHAASGKDLHVFRYVASGMVEYIGQYVYTGHSFRDAPDVHGNIRKTIVFQLKPIGLT
jgi:5-methylcytosine-specific restriction protein A